MTDKQMLAKLEQAEKLLKQTTRGYNKTGQYWKPAMKLLDECQAALKTPAVSKEEASFARLVDAMKGMSDRTPGYQLGGGHGVPLRTVRYDQKLDCSSSTSKALYDAGLFEGREYAIVSGRFNEWGAPGPGKLFTVYYNAEHVWVRLHRTKWFRFDTSPHGDGGRGPKLRMLPRFTSGFQTRHFPGM